MIRSHLGMVNPAGHQTPQGGEVLALDCRRDEPVASDRDDGDWQARRHRSHHDAAAQAAWSRAQGEGLATSIDGPSAQAATKHLEQGRELRKEVKGLK
jgi:hypothetical protein